MDENPSEGVQAHTENADPGPGIAPSADIPVAAERVVLRLDIKDAETSLSVTLTGEAVIGRRELDSDSVPDIDLTPFGGYRKGISRRHAVLHVQDDQLRLTDMGSHNGTFLNGHRIPACQTALVNDGDEIRVGQIVFYVRGLLGE